MYHIEQYTMSQSNKPLMQIDALLFPQSGDISGNNKTQWRDEHGAQQFYNDITDFGFFSFLCV